MKRVYQAQKENPSKGDFIELVKTDLDMIGEPFNEEEIISKNKNTFKTHIKRKVIEAAFRDLKNTQRTHSKVKDIVYEKF